MRLHRRIEPIVWGIVGLLAFIGVVAVGHRAAVLLDPALSGNFAPARALDANFARHPDLTLIHIIPGFLFMVLGPLQFVRRIRARWRELEGGIVGGNVSGRIDFNGAVELGDPNGADLPGHHFHRGAAFLALAGDRLLDFARTQVAGDVNVRLSGTIYDY